LSSQALIVVRSISFRSESTSLNGGMVGFRELSFTFTVDSTIGRP
jgi:hypothetical protein